MLVKKTQDDSKRLLLSAFGKQPRYVWLYRDGAEVQIPLDKLQAGDIDCGEHRRGGPGRRIVSEGMAMIDQHALTGESTPAEKGVGDRVFASTLMVAGKIYVEVENAGSETASAKISQILQRHRRLQADVAAQGRAAGRQGRDTDARARRTSAWRRWARRRRGDTQQRLRHRHPHGRAAGDALVARAVRAQGNSGQGRPRTGADERGRHRPLR